MKKVILLLILCHVGWHVYSQKITQCEGIHQKEFIEYVSINRDSSLMVFTKNNGVLKLQNCELLADIFQTKKQFNSFIQNAHIETMFLDQKYIWIGTLGDGLKVFYRTTGKEIKEQNKLYGCITQLNETVYEIYKIYHQNTPEGHIKWLVTDKGLFTIHKNKELKQASVFKGKHFTALASYNNVMWAASSDGKLWKRSVFNLTKGIEWQRVKMNQTKLGFVRDMAFDASGRLWIAGKNLLKYNPLLDKTTIYAAKAGIKSNRISCITMAKGHLIWVGTEGGGLYKIQAKPFDNNSIDIYNLKKKKGKLEIKLKLSRALTKQESEKTEFKLVYEDGPTLLLKMLHTPEIPPKLLTNQTFLKKWFRPIKGKLQKGKYSLKIMVKGKPVGQIQGVM